MSACLRRRVPGRHNNAFHYRRGAVALIFSLATNCRGCATLGGDILGASQFGLDLFDCGEGAFELLR